MRITEVKKTTPERLRDLADFLDDHGIGMGDHSDRPLIEAAANAIERMERTINEVAAAIQAGGLANYVPPSPGNDATVSLAECITAAAGKIEAGRLELQQAWAELKQARESVVWWQGVAEAKQEERDRFRAALEMLAQVRHVSGSAQPAFRMNLHMVDAVLAGADVRDVDTVEAIAAGTWKP